MTSELKKLLEALENERRYMARELHDSVAQTTLQLGLQAGICRKLLERGNLAMLNQELVDLEGRLQWASTQVRHLIADLRPPALEPEATLTDYIKFAIDTHLDRGGPPVECHFNLSTPLPDLPLLQKLSLSRVVQEALLNVRKHAQAKNIRLTLTADANQLYVIIADNGKGFDFTEVEARAPERGGFGLANLRTRIEALGGTLTIGRDDTENWIELKLTLPKPKPKKSKKSRSL